MKDLIDRQRHDNERMKKEVTRTLERLDNKELQLQQMKEDLQNLQIRGKFGGQDDGRQSQKQEQLDRALERVAYLERQLDSQSRDISKMQH